MKYYLDTEFNEHGGELISLSLVREDNESLYITFNIDSEYGPWVNENVVPHLFSVPTPFPGRVLLDATRESAQAALTSYFYGVHNPEIITDWPEDIRYFTELLITSPGEMINLSSLTFRMYRVDSYPTKVKDAVRHNAFWDAMALKSLFESASEY